MTASPFGLFVRRLAAPAEPDGELLRRFVATRCESAFADLVRRHGPAVFGLCRRALGDHHLAEDTFQTVFVVLARKAHVVRPPEAVSGWLYGVARKAAAEAAAARRRKQREHLPGTLPELPAPAAPSDDTAATVDAEIAALSPLLRAAVVLCEIEGLSRAAAARRLGIAEGTLSSRLARARKLLTARLRRRGLGAATGGVVAVPAALVSAAAASANGRAAAAVLELTHKVLRTMPLSNLYIGPVLLALALAAGLLVAPGTTSADRPGPRRAAAQFPVRAPAPKAEWVPEFTLQHESAVSAVAFGRERLATFEVGRAQPRPRLWAAADGKELGIEVRGAWFTNLPARLLRFTRNDEHLVMVNLDTFSDAPSGSATRYRSIPGAAVGDTLSAFDTVAFSADLSTVVNRERPAPKRPARADRLSLHDNPWATVEGDDTPRAVLEYPGGRAILGADLSADGRRLAVAGEDGAIRVYDPATLRELHAIRLKKGTELTAMRLSDDGARLAAVGASGFARVFDAAGAELCELKVHTGRVTAVAFSPDGKRVAAACGREVRVFDATTGKPVGSIAGHENDVRALAFGPDGRRLVTGSADKTAKVWKLKE